jgi:hypothetical protein
MHVQVLLENITTEPHAQDISADILRVWLSGYILQQVYRQIHTPIDTRTHTHIKYSMPCPLNVRCTYAHLQVCVCASICTLYMDLYMFACIFLDACVCTYGMHAKHANAAREKALD